MKVLLFANTDWYLYNFRRELALALRARGDDVLLVSPPGEYVRRLQALGFRWMAFPLSRRGMDPFAELGTIRRLVGLYRQEQPDLVHHFTIKPVLYGALAARRAGIHTVVNSITGLGWVFMPGPAWKRFLRFLVRRWYRWVLRSSQVIFENDDDRRAFQETGLVKAQTAHFIPGVGVDTERLFPTPFPPGAPVILLAARLLWDKGIGEYIEAARRLRAEGVPAYFRLAGRPDPGNPTSIPVEQVETWQAEGKIEWLGWVEDISTAIQDAHIICLPSYREGLPTMLIEAAACGRPVVATDVPGCRFAVRDGINGLLVPQRDAASLAEALRKLITDPVLCQRMGAAGRRLAEEVFSSNKVIHSIMEIYTQALVEGKNDGR